MCLREGGGGVIVGRFRHFCSGRDIAEFMSKRWLGNVSIKIKSGHI